MTDGPTIGQAAHAAAERLAGAGIPALEARLDAELLARHVLGRWDRATFIVRGHERVPAGFPSEFESLVARRERHEPIAYIVGHAEFWALDFEVTPDVLVPRPETELVVECATGLFRDRPAPDAIVDVGTGSGCIAVALAHEFPAARLTATDVSAAALEVARRNARRHGVDDRITFEHAAFTGRAGPCQLVASNPPYVATGDRVSLPPEVRDHEPATALFAGEDGLDAIRGLVTHARRVLLADDAWLVFEFGFGQDDAVREVLGQAGFDAIELRQDLQGIPRVAVGRVRAAR